MDYEVIFFLKNITIGGTPYGVDFIIIIEKTSSFSLQAKHRRPHIQTPNQGGKKSKEKISDIK